MDKGQLVYLKLVINFEEEKNILNDIDFSFSDIFFIFFILYIIGDIKLG